MQYNKKIICVLILLVLVLTLSVTVLNFETIKFDIKVNIIRSKVKEKYDNNYNINGKAVVYISIGNLKENAVIKSGLGNNLLEAFNNVISSTKKYIKETNYQVEWVKIDIVNDMYEKNVKDLKSYIKEQDEGNFIYGFSLDSKFEKSFLEAQVNINQLINYNRNELSINNINKILDKKVESIPQTVILFKCCGYIYDNKVYELHNDNDNYGRRQDGNFTKDKLKKIIKNSEKYLNNQILEDGKFIYGYKEAELEELTSYNILRHTGTIWSMINAYKVSHNIETKRNIERGINYIINNTIKYQDDVAYVLEEKNGEIKLGANSLSVIMLTEYMDVFNTDKYKDLVAKLGNGIIRMKKNDGSFVHVLNYPAYNIKDEFRTVYYDGEAIFALVKLYGFIKDEKYINQAKQCIDYCISMEYTQYRDHWISYALNEFTKYNNEVKYYNFAMNNISDNILKVMNNKATSPITLELLLCGFETYNRAIENKIEINANFGEKEIKNWIKYRGDYLLNGYLYPEYAMYFDNPQKILYAFFTRNDKFRVRIDDLQHNIGGYYLIYKNYESIFE